MPRVQIPSPCPDFFPFVACCWRGFPTRVRHKSLDSFLCLSLDLDLFPRIARHTTSLSLGGLLFHVVGAAWWSCGESSAAAAAILDLDSK